MAQTAAQLDAGARELGRRLYVELNSTAVLTHDDLRAAIQSIDATMDLLPAALTPAQTVKQNIAVRLPEPFKSRTTTVEKSQALMVWSMTEVGLLNGA